LLPHTHARAINQSIYAVCRQEQGLDATATWYVQDVTPS